MWARIAGGVIAELTDLDPAGRFHPDLIWAPCPDDARPGWLATHGEAGWTFAAPAPAAPVVPRSVSAFQARAALHAMPSPHAGYTLLDDVEAAVAAADPVVRMAWEYSTVIERGSPTLKLLAPQLGLAPADLDALFIAAAAIAA